MNRAIRWGWLAALVALLAVTLPADAAGCKGCHKDVAATLPKAHPAVKGGDLAACLACHKPDAKGEAKKNAFSVAMHRGHVKAGGGVPCADCHVVNAKGKRGVARGKVVLVADKEMLGLMTGVMTDAGAAQWSGGMHAKAGIGCAGCHGSATPGGPEEVGNDRCLACHGPMDALVDKTKPADHADRNPHRSHLGDIACTVCHKGHQASKVYCLDCHPKWPMKIGGAAPR